MVWWRWPIPARGHRDHSAGDGGGCEGVRVLLSVLPSENLISPHYRELFAKMPSFSRFYDLKQSTPLGFLKIPTNSNGWNTEKNYTYILGYNHISTPAKFFRWVGIFIQWSVYRPQWQPWLLCLYQGAE